MCVIRVNYCTKGVRVTFFHHHNIFFFSCHFTTVHGETSSHLYVKWGLVIPQPYERDAKRVKLKMLLLCSVTQPR